MTKIKNRNLMDVDFIFDSSDRAKVSIMVNKIDKGSIFKNKWTDIEKFAKSLINKGDDIYYVIDLDTNVFAVRNISRLLKGKYENKCTNDHILSASIEFDDKKVMFYNSDIIFKIKDNFKCKKDYYEELIRLYGYRNELGDVSNTAAGSALSDAKETVGLDKFRKLFPQGKGLPNSDMLYYRGGLTYVGPDDNEIVNNGLYIDINSMYPSIMRYSLLPTGYPERIFNPVTNPDDSDVYCYIYKCHVSAKVRDNHIPCLRKLGLQPDGQTWFKDMDCDITLTQPEMDMLFENYYVYNIDIIDCYKYKGVKGVFKDYIDKWEEIKNNSDDSVMKKFAKIRLNSLFGKTIQSRGSSYNFSYYPYGYYILSIGRKMIIDNANKLIKNGNRVLYIDTDSIQFQTNNSMKDLKDSGVIDSLEKEHKELGKFSMRFEFEKAKYLGIKQYTLKGKNGETKNAFAGLVKDSTNSLTPELSLIHI